MKNALAQYDAMYYYTIRTCLSSEKVDLGGDDAIARSFLAWSALNAMHI